MDPFKAQFARLQSQLSGLTSSQKMLAAALVAIMAMTLVWWGRYAGEAEYEPLLNQTFSTDDIAQITNHLDAKGIHYTVVSDRIMVPADRKMEVIGDLAFSHLLPKKTDAGFDEIVGKMTPWDPADKTAHLWEQAKQRTLEAVIETFPNVRQADVIIDPRDERRFDGQTVTPTAMVNIITHDAGSGGRGAKETALAAADMVAGAVGGLNRGSVTVIVDGATIPIPDKNSPDSLPDGDSIVDTIRAHEDMYRDKIKELLGFIGGGLFVSVRVDLNTKMVDTQETTVDAKNTAHLSQTEEDQSTDTTTPGAGGEAGAVGNLQANGGLSVGGGAAGGGGGTSNQTEEKISYVVIPSQRVQHTVQGPGDAPPVSASVRVPRSYFVAMYKAANKDAEPDDATLEPLMKEEMDRIRSDVKSCTGIKIDDAVTVNWYSDQAMADMPGIPGLNHPVSSGLPVTLLLEQHVRDIGVGVLAIASLFMVMMMVRKSVPTPISVPAAVAAAEKGSQRLPGDSQVAGEVSEGDKSLDGMELDEEAIQTQQVVEQVSNMVNKNPDAAANLVKRWLTQT